MKLLRHLNFRGSLMCDPTLFEITMKKMYKFEVKAQNHDGHSIVCEIG